MEFFFKVDFDYRWSSSKMLLDSLNHKDTEVSNYLLFHNIKHQSITGVGNFSSQRARFTEKLSSRAIVFLKKFALK